MDQEMTIELRDGYIHAECSGIETLARSTEVFTTIITKVIEWECDRVLYVEHYTNQIPLSEMLTMLEQVFKLVEEQGINGRIAIYDSNINDQEINMLSGSLAGSRGINAKVFLDQEQAIDWLTS
jgi:hypothetical protein